MRRVPLPTRWQCPQAPSNLTACESLARKKWHTSSTAHAHCSAEDGLRGEYGRATRGARCVGEQHRAPAREARATDLWHTGPTRACMPSKELSEERLQTRRPSDNAKSNSTLRSLALRAEASVTENPQPSAALLNRSVLHPSREARSNSKSRFEEPDYRCKTPTIKKTSLVPHSPESSTIAPQAPASGDHPDTVSIPSQ